MVSFERPCHRAAIEHDAIKLIAFCTRETEQQRNVVAKRKEDVTISRTCNEHIAKACGRSKPLQKLRTICAESGGNRLMQTSRMREALAALLDLARTRIAFMVVISCAVGYVLAFKGTFDYLRFACALIGTGLLSSGGCAINCYIERDLDAMMPRTARRPIPAGVISPRAALLYGIFLVVTGALILLFFTNTLCAALGLAAVAIYLGMYTPAKRWTWLNTSIGAVPGAIPPLIGWAAASGEISAGGWILFAMLFIWQHTHFLPIAWLYKEDYKAAGFKMLPALSDSAEMTYRLTIATAIVLLPLSAMLYCADNPIAGPAYRLASLVSGVILVATSVRWRKNPSRKAARMVLLMSLVYLPAVFAAVILDRVCGWT